MSRRAAVVLARSAGLALRGDLQPYMAMGPALTRAGAVAWQLPTNGVFVSHLKNYGNSRLLHTSSSLAQASRMWRGQESPYMVSGELAASWYILDPCHAPTPMCQHDLSLCTRTHPHVYFFTKLTLCAATANAREHGFSDCA